MRSYRQFCGLAKSLDVVGDRWTLLIVRELLIRGPSRYSDLRAGLPGIPTNLLANRLREMEAAGLIERDMASAPTPAALYKLTSRGEALESVIAALGRWAGPLLAVPEATDVFLPHWLVLPARLYLVDRTPQGPAVSIEVRDQDERVTLEARNGSVRARVGPAKHPDVVVTGPTAIVWQLLIGKIDVARAQAAGVRIEGRRAALRRFGPRPPRNAA
ncbi:MAG TPA: winged helix-turn-helix transcriptional regulator [Tepidiformaceae bacterium]|nr:winged helix-turn-helix transcriptional regulator [Tepidiformaceae bacterium]